MTDRVLLFCNILACSTLAFAGIACVVIFRKQAEAMSINPRAVAPRERAQAFGRSLILAFVASAWLCAGRCA